MENYKADVHIHSSYSFDSDLPIKTIIEREKELGNDVIAITDHVEFAQKNILQTVNSLAKREKEIRKYEQEKDILVIRGVEISEPHLYKEYVEFLRNMYGIEYIIGSIHHLNGKSFRYNKDAVDDYLRLMLDMVTYGDMDTLAHMDYIKKYGTKRNLDKSLIDEILTTIIARGITLEINSSGYRRCGSPFPSVEILERYIDLGGSNVVIGSDAHQKSELYDGVKQAYEDIKELKLNKGVIVNKQFKSI